MLEFLKNIFSASSFNVLLSYLEMKNPLDIIKTIVDVSIVSYIIYKLIQLVRETRAIQLIKGAAVILIAYYISNLLGLRTIEYILRNTLQLAAIILVILFQPELRRGLEKIGRSRFRDFFTLEEEESLLQITTMIEHVVKAAEVLSKKSTGALIVIEREIKLGEVVNSGVQVDSVVTAELLVNIFTPYTPLHDGAVVIRGNRIMAAASFLPLTDNQDLSKEFGTRHRAALGVTEISDAIVVVVSEETGKISFAMSGGLTRNLTFDSLRKALNKNLLEKKPYTRRLPIWKVKTK